jgi:hypothetical protein
MSIRGSSEEVLKRPSCGGDKVTALAESPLSWVKKVPEAAHFLMLTTAPEPPRWTVHTGTPPVLEDLSRFVIGGHSAGTRDA